MGHALVAATLPGVDPVHKVSIIIPRGVGELGYTMQRPTEDRFLLGRQELENRHRQLKSADAREKYAVRLFLCSDRDACLGDVAPNGEGAVARSATFLGGPLLWIGNVKEVRDLIVN